MITLGIERLLSDPIYRKQLTGKKIAFVAHQGSVDRHLKHSLSLLTENSHFNIVCAIGPQHGLRGDKQDNMIESEDFIDSEWNIPVFSMYGKSRRVPQAALDLADVFLFDLQDLGCRIYTFVTTLKYLLEDCAKASKAVWILDRPNPAGRFIDGLILERGWESFVGAGQFPMRYGLTVGELAQWFVRELKISVELTVLSMDGYQINESHFLGWPSDLTWVNSSPNAASVNMAHCYSGTVLLEGTTFSEGRGTTRPLEQFGAPNIVISDVMKRMNQIKEAWLKGVVLRRVFFEPTFHKHQGLLCQGLQIHTDHFSYNPNVFKPYRLIALFLKSIRELYPEYEIWRNFDYEYEFGKRPIDVINGSPTLRLFVEGRMDIEEFEKRLNEDELSWKEKGMSNLIYNS